METLEEIKKGNKVLRIYHDENPQDPRKWDNFGKMVLKHNRYNFPNEINLNFDNFNNLNEIEEYLKKEHKAEVILLINLYDHSGISLSTSLNYPYNCCWDSSQIGFIFCSKEDIKKEGITKKQAELNLMQEVKTYSQYLEGDVYGFIIIEEIKVKVKREYPKGEITETEETEEKDLDSCWGYIGEEGIKQIKEENKF